MFDPYGMYGYDPRFAPNHGPQRPIPRPGYTDHPQGQNGQQAGPGWVFVPRVDDIVNVTVQPGAKSGSWPRISRCLPSGRRTSWA